MVFRDSSKEALLEHVREHSKPEEAVEDGKLHIIPNKKPENTPDPADLAYRCGHCNQLSNWKHVIQVLTKYISINFFYKKCILYITGIIFAKFLHLRMHKIKTNFISISETLSAKA